jgi:heme oxygenase
MNQSPACIAASLHRQAHLARLAVHEPRLLIAHSATQHLAVASGGQIIARMARKHLRLPEDAGTAAYEFTVRPILTSPACLT